MIMQERDFEVFRLINRFRFCLGRNIKVLCDFSSERTCNRRLKLLVENGYLTRKNILYGVPALYFLTHKSKVLIGANASPQNVRIDRIYHDIAMLDVVPYLLKKYNLKLADITTERELQSKNGFSPMRHYPDCIFMQNSQNYCIEIELSPKAKTRLTKNIQQNFIEYDVQIWIIPQNETVITTGYGSAKRVREFLIHPDEIKAFRTGQCIFVSRDNGSISKILVNKPF